MAISGYGELFIVDDLDFKIKSKFKIDNIPYWNVTMLSDKSLILSGDSNIIFQIRIEDGKLLSKISIHLDSIPSVMELKNNILVTCSYDNTIRFWQIKK